jgi:hypothetical protein
MEHVMASSDIACAHTFVFSFGTLAERMINAQAKE